MKKRKLVGILALMLVLGVTAVGVVYARSIDGVYVFHEARDGVNGTRFINTNQRRVVVDFTHGPNGVPAAIGLNGHENNPNGRGTYNWYPLTNVRNIRVRNQ